MDKKMEGQTDTQVDIHVDVWTDKRMNTQKNGRTDIDGHANIEMSSSTES